MLSLLERMFLRIYRQRNTNGRFYYSVLYTRAKCGHQSGAGASNFPVVIGISNKVFIMIPPYILTLDFIFKIGYNH